METRKLVKTGAETFTLSLPKEWVRKNKLNKGDLLFICQNKGSLEIRPAEGKEKKEEKEITITIDDKDISTLRRETISAYINNNTKLSFIGESLNGKMEDIRKILHNFLALEIIEHTDKRLVVKDYLDLKEFSLDNIIRRMDMLVRSIIIDSKNSFEKKGVHENLKLRDYEVDKLFFLLNRLVRSRDISPKEAISYFWTAKTLESISDDIKEIAEEFEKTRDKKMILAKYEEIENYYKEAIKAYMKNDKQLADKLISQRTGMTKDLEKIKEKGISVRLQNIIANSRNIAKIALDS
jgi:phosphate uptake regulator